jgi:hypothetical protein
MTRGAFVMFDVLGFKEISRRVPSDEVFQKFKVMRDHFRQEEATWPKLFELRFAFVSDTVVVGVRSPDASLPQFAQLQGMILTQADLDGLAIMFATLWASVVLRIGVEAAPAWTYRGCMSFGDFEIEDNFYVGPAVYRAAEHYEKAQGAFVWLAPDAEEALERAGATNGEFLLPRFAVPLKGGATYETHVVVPLALDAHKEGRAALVERLLATFDGAPSLDVALKKQATAAFLRRQLAVWTDAARAMGKLIERLPEPTRSEARRVYANFVHG